MDSTLFAAFYSLWGFLPLYPIFWPPLLGIVRQLPDLKEGRLNFTQDHTAQLYLYIPKLFAVLLYFFLHTKSKNISCDCNYTKQKMLCLGFKICKPGVPIYSIAAEPQLKFTALYPHTNKLSILSFALPVPCDRRSDYKH